MKKILTFIAVATFTTNVNAQFNFSPITQLLTDSIGVIFDLLSQSDEYYRLYFGDFLTSHLELENNKVLNMLIPEFTILSIFDVIYRLDWLSLFLGAEHGFDPMKIKNIMELKDLSSISVSSG